MGTNADGWISIAERLPPYYDTLCDEGEQQRIAQVLVYTRWFELAVAMRVRDDSNGPPRWDCDDGRINVDEITHWMPLPEPPK